MRDLWKDEICLTLIYLDNATTFHASVKYIIYRFTRLPFGLTSSPFLLSATLRELATRFRDRYPIAAKLLDQSIFTDDFTASVEHDLKLDVMECRDLCVSAFETPPATSSQRRFVRFDTKGILTNSTISLTVFESFQSFAPHLTVPHDVRMLSHTRKKVQLADPKNDPEEASPPSCLWCNEFPGDAILR